MFAKGSSKSQRQYIVRILICLIGLTQASVKAGTLGIDFEGFADSTILTTQHPGLTFQNTIILTVGIGINEFEFPPRSGVNLASDDGGPIVITFESPVLSFGGFFTYGVPLTIQAFDATSVLIASATSAFSSNDALFGDASSSPNEFMQVSFAGGISSVTITGDPGGGSFALDDATVTTADVATPEPTSFIFLLTIATALAVRTRRREHNH